jgi:hypothetical protein
MDGVESKGTCVKFLDFFFNFTSSCAWYVHSICFLRFNGCGFAATVCDWIMALD